MFNKPPLVDIVDSTSDFIRALRRLDETGMVSSMEIEKLIKVVKTDVSLILMNFNFDGELKKIK